MKFSRKSVDDDFRTLKQGTWQYLLAFPGFDAHARYGSTKENSEEVENLVLRIIFSKTTRNLVFLMVDWPTF